MRKVLTVRKEERTTLARQDGYDVRRVLRPWRARSGREGREEVGEREERGEKARKEGKGENTRIYLRLGQDITLTFYHF